MTMVAHLAGGMALACVAGAAIADVRDFEIPDGWSIAVAVPFVAFAAVAVPPGLWWQHGVTGVGLYLVGALLFSRGWLGGGDVKLLAACALWAGFGALPALLLGTAAAGGVLAAIALAARRLAPADVAYPGLCKDGPLPYAVAIFAGALATLRTMS